LKAAIRSLFRKQRIFFVYGEVGRPGRYRLKQGMTAIQAVSSACGYTTYAAEKHLKVLALCHV